MTDLGDPSVARQIRHFAEARAKQVVASQALRRVWATVSEVQDPTQTGRGGTATVTDGLGRASYGVRWLGRRPAVGQVVLVEVPPPGGTRLILAINDEAPESVPFDASVLDGYATGVQLTNHAATTPLHRIQEVTLNTGASDNNKWVLILAGSVTDQYGFVTGELALAGAGAHTAIWTRARICLYLRQEAAFGNDPVAKVNLVSAGDITTSNVVLVVTSNAGPTTFGLYLQLTRTNEFALYGWTLHYPYQVLYDPLTPDGLQSCSPFLASLPAGTQFVSV